MKFTIGYTVFNKAHLLEKIIDSVAALHDVSSFFFFDACTDNSVSIFKRDGGKLNNCRAFANYGCDMFETFSNNFILKMLETDLCILIQDDMIIKGSELFELAGEIYAHDSAAGLVGFKDGYEMNVTNVYEDFISAPWSTSKHKNMFLKRNEYCKKTYVNRGPLCVSRKLIERIGYLDEDFYPLFWDDNDYSKRSAEAGFNNYVAYSEIESDISWGATRVASKVPYRHLYVANQYRFAKKWNVPLPPMSSALLLRSIFTSKMMKLKQRIRGRRNEVLIKEIL